MKTRFTLKIHPAGGLLFALAFLFADSHSVLASTAALILHEGAHLAAMRLCGIKECTVEITPFGGMADAKQFAMYSPMRRTVSAFAGVAASAAAAYACTLCIHTHMFWSAFLQANLSLALLNALPAWPLDGARVVVALAAYIGLEETVKQILSWLTTVLGVCLIAVGLYGAWHGIINLSLFFIGPYLCYASRNEMLSDKVRRIGEMEQKDRIERILPVYAAAVESGGVRNAFQQLVFHGDRGRYRMLAEIDAQNGSVRKWWTEQEMLEALVHKTSN